METSPSRSPDNKGKLFIIGTGPGSEDQLTPAAANAISRSEYVLGNGTYLEMLAPLLEGKKVIKSGMGREIERAKKSLELSQDHFVSMVSGGDPGIYGMASIVLEIAEASGSTVDIEIIPGITSASASAALLGSPLSGDFVVISLSDLLTPWEIIQDRLTHAFSMGVPVVIYNPRSNGRPYNFKNAMDIALKVKAPDTPVGIVKNAFRDGERVFITTLKKIHDDHDEVDMHSTVIVGGEGSRIWRSDNGERIITPRGYHRKYDY
jgi:precorrin-3B C17-methyltransferase